MFSYFPLCISDVYEVSTQDGLTLYIDKGDPSIQYITIDDFPVSKEKQPAGFMLLDIEKNLSNVSIADPNYIKIEGELTNLVDREKLFLIRKPSHFQKVFMYSRIVC